MAKINPVRVKADADKEERAGRLDKAIDLLKQIVQDNPRDWNTIGRIGGLYDRLNDPQAANEYYVKVADFYAKDGFYLKAIAVWKKIAKNDPTLLESYLHLADLYAKQGLPVEAKTQYQTVIDEYIKRNKVEKAGEALQRMKDLDPTDLKTRIRLADLYLRQGKPEQAAAEYVAIADELVKKGHLAEALQLLEKGLKISPKSPRLLAELGRVHLVQKDYARAAQHLEEAHRATPADRDVTLQLADAYLGSKRPEDAQKLLKALLDKNAADQEARQHLGRVFLVQGRYDEAFEQLLPSVDKMVERRDGERAAAVLQQIIQRRPDHIVTLTKLAEIHRVFRNDVLAAQTYSQLVEAYLNHGEHEQAASILAMLVELEPHNEQHRSKLEWLRVQAPSPSRRPAAPPAGFVDEFVELPPSPPPKAPPPPQRPEPPAGAVPRIELSGPLTGEDREFVDEHLAEGRVFRKYGLIDKAKDQLEAVLARFPDNVDARLELKDLFKEKGESEKAAEQLRLVAQVHRLRGDAAAASRVDNEAAALAGPPAAAIPVAPAAEPRPAPAPAPPLGAPLGAEIEVPIALDEPRGEPEAEADQELELLETPPEPEPVPEASFEQDLGLPEGELSGGFIEEETPARERISAAELGIDIDAEAPPVEPPPAPSFVPPEGRRDARSALPADLQRTLEEIESYVSLGFVDDAREALAEVSAVYADHPALNDLLGRLGLEAVAAPPETARRAVAPARPRPAPRQPPPVSGMESLVEEPVALGAEALEPMSLGDDLASLLGGGTATASDGALPPVEDLSSGAALTALPDDSGVDLATELDELFAPQSAMASEPEPATEGTALADAALADIFREFKKGVDRQLGREDYETRYNLGIAYKEMGLVDEAIAEFQLAAKDESRLLECSSMLGLCFLEKGMPKLAVKWFERGLLAPGRSDEELRALRYDLAVALEAAGERERALGLYAELYGQDANFRDVASKVRELQAGR